MSKRPQDPLLEHEYDGIREYDNPCPTWWHAIFLVCVVFSVFYFIFFQIAPYAGTNGWSVEEAYDETVSVSLQQQFAEIGELEVNEENVRKYMDEPDWLKVGEATFKMHCKSCHAEDGSGLVGPNLTDEHYKNVKRLGDIATVIEQGAANGSMPAWRTRFHPNVTVMVSAYVANMRGRNLTGPRGTEGSVIPSWPESAELPAPDEPETGS